MKAVWTGSKMGADMTKEPFGWEPLLRKWSQEWLTCAKFASILPKEVIESGWLGYPGASEEQIAGPEQRLGVMTSCE
jgi:hypothetical protein